MKRFSPALAPTLLILVAALSGCGSARKAPAAPVPVPTELLNPAVTPETVQKTICVPAYAASVSPSAAEDRTVTHQLMQRSGNDTALSASFALDRRVPVELGGNPTERANLQLLEWGGEYGMQRKQALVRRLLLNVCEGRMSLRDAQAAIYPDWQPAYARYVDDLRR